MLVLEEVFCRMPCKCPFIMKYLRISVKHHSLDPNLYGNKAMIFSNEINEPMQSNLSGEEWTALRALAAVKPLP